MKIVFVTSRVTYVRDNYYTLLKRLASENEDATLLVIDNMSPGLLIKALCLIGFGAWKTGMILIQNMIASLKGRRETLFRNVHHFRTINSPDSIAFLKSQSPDLIVNLRTREIFGKHVLSIPSIGCVNVHHGLLPDNRGTLCDLWALHEGRDVGFSIHVMNERIDAGEILATHTLNVRKETDYTRIPMISSIKEADLLCDILRRFKTGRPVVRRPNTPDKRLRYTTNPTAREIRIMKQSGMTL